MPIRSTVTEQKLESKTGKETAPAAVPGREGNAETAAENPPAQTQPDSSLDLSKPYDRMNVEELQAAILQKLARNGPVTDQMRRDVAANVWRDSLLNWVKSFR